MPKTDESQSHKSSSKDTRPSEGEVQGRYPTSAEHAASIERAQETKKKHESLFRRLAGKDDE